eukprot:sb/3472619/
MRLILWFLLSLVVNLHSCECEEQGTTLGHVTRHIPLTVETSSIHSSWLPKQAADNSLTKYGETSDGDPSWMLLDYGTEVEFQTTTVIILNTETQPVTKQEYVMWMNEAIPYILDSNKEKFVVGAGILRVNRSDGSIYITGEFCQANALTTVLARSARIGSGQC